MNNYRYEAVDKAGKTVRGVMNAADEQAVAQRLVAMGFVLQSIVPPAAAQVTSQAGARTSQASQATPKMESFPVSIDSCIKLAPLGRFIRQLATLVRAGVPMAQSLHDVVGTTSNPKLRRAADDMRVRVEGGASLSSSMAAHPSLFPVHVVGVVWGGEMGGYLDAALDDAATEIEQEAKDRRYGSIGWFLANINIVALIFMIPLINLKGFVIKALGDAGKLAGGSGTYGSKNFVPDGLSRDNVISGLISAYLDSVVHICLPILVAWLVGRAVWHRLKRVPQVRRMIDAALVYVPGWGGMHRERARSRFLRTLHRQYEAGVAPGQAWAAASMSVRNSEIARRLREHESDARQQGGSLELAFARSGVFASDDSGMVATGERAGAVPDMLSKMADHHASVADTSKSRQKVLSIIIFIVGLSVITGYITFLAMQSYMDFAFSAPKLLGLE